MERCLATDAFLGENPGVTVNVEDGAGVAIGICTDTFRVLEGHVDADAVAAWFDGLVFSQSKTAGDRQ